MAKLTIEELTTPVTREQVQASIYQVLAALGVNTTVWKPGSVVRTMIVGTSAVFAAFSQLMADIAKSGFLYLSSGDWLTLVARYVYNVERIEEDFARGVLRLDNAGGGIFNLDAGDLTVATAAGQTYVNTEAVSIPSLGTNILVGIIATEAGSVGSTPAATIVQIVSPPMSGVSCTNPAELVGLDTQTDPDLQLVCSERLGALSPFGPWDAYSFALRQARMLNPVTGVFDGSSIGITRVRLVPDGFGRVYAYVATASGAVTGDPNDPSTPLGAAAEAVQQSAAPQGISAIVGSATEAVIAINYEAWIYNTSGYTELQIKERIGSALSAFFAAQPVGGNVIGSPPGRLFRNGVIAAIKGAMPEIFQVAVLTPSTDIIMAQIYRVPVLGFVTGTIHQEPPPEGFHP